MKEFVTAAKPKLGTVDRGAAIKTKHDGKEVTFYEPDPGSLAIMLMITSQVGPKGEGLTVQQMGEFIAFIFNTMENETALYFRKRLMDPEDSFTFSDPGGLMDIFKELSKEWSARPTKSPSGSRPARRATGKGSTAPTRVRA